MPGAYSATERPPVSVVVRSYNRLDALAELIPIILKQTFTNFELVIVEQSTQKSPEQIARLAFLERDPRIRIFPFPPLGGPRSRNESARVARGDIIVFIDDDDIPGTERVRIFSVFFFNFFFKLLYLGFIKCREILLSFKLIL